MTLRFVVTGCARSGTTYVTRLLAECGVRCGHEAVFRVHSREVGYVRDLDAARDRQLVGDSSCFAAVDDSGDLVRVHLVRPPLDTIASLQGRELLTDRFAFWPFKARHAPLAAECPPGVQRAAAYWVEWNELASRGADLTWRLPHLDGHDVMRLSAAAGLGLEEDRVARAVEITPRNVNGRDHGEVILERLGDFAETVEAAAAEYGVPLTQKEADYGAASSAGELE